VICAQAIHSESHTACAVLMYIAHKHNQSPIKILLYEGNKFKTLW